MERIDFRLPDGGLKAWTWRQQLPSVKLFPHLKPALLNAMRSRTKTNRPPVTVGNGRANSGWDVNPGRRFMVGKSEHLHPNST
jgi:hypothetical protein